MRGLELHTVCEEARCPNIGECWGNGTMTIMILGGMCTRACPFCAVDTGNPRGWIDPDEPANVAEAVRRLKLGYVVLTSVDRDDLPDQGAGHFAACIAAVRGQREQAVDLIREALAQGFSWNIWVHREPDFESLRDFAPFQELLRPKG